MKHGEAVVDAAPAEAQGVHEARGEDSGAACVTEAKDAFERGDELQAKGTWWDVVVDRAHLVEEEVL
jgi:hypothetical protein